MHRDLGKHWGVLQTQNAGLKQILEMVMLKLSIEACVGLVRLTRVEYDIPHTSVEVVEYIISWELHFVEIFIGMIGDGAGIKSCNEVLNAMLRDWSNVMS